MSTYKRKTRGMSDGAKVMWAILLIICLPLLLLLVGVLFATLTAPFIAVAWNVGLVAMLAQFGVTLTSIGLGTAWNYAWGILLLGMIFKGSSAARRSSD
jgi:hypothetical protein